jgi:hypothetical protein
MNKLTKGTMASAAETTAPNAATRTRRCSGTGPLAPRRSRARLSWAQRRAHAGPSLLRLSSSGAATACPLS